MDEQDKIVFEKWYVITCHKGHEDIIAENIKAIFDSKQIANKLMGIKIIKKKLRNKKGDEHWITVYPGYIYLSVDMDNETWYIIRNITGVFGFIGSTGKRTKPIPLTQKEVKKLKKEESDFKNAEALFDTDITLESHVKILKHDLFEGQTGTVKSINLKKGIFEVELEFMGKMYKLHIGFKSVKKMN